jgi:type IV secretion system protein VirB3
MDRDPVFLGLTRPPMVWGVPQPLFVLNGMVSMLGFLMLDSFLPLLLGAPILHAVAYIVCLKEVRALDLWVIRARFVRCINRSFWGANSYDPS